jgi:glutaredoxin
MVSPQPKWQHITFSHDADHRSTLKSMKITVYKSSLCPRCFAARKALEKLTADRNDIDLEYVDILTAPGRLVQDGIRMIPALKANGQILSGIFLSKKSIATFLAEITRN